VYYLLVILIHVLEYNIDLILIYYLNIGTWTVERKMIGLVVAGPLRLQVSEIKAETQKHDTSALEMT